MNEVELHIYKGVSYGELYSTQFGDADDRAVAVVEAMGRINPDDEETCFHWTSEVIEEGFVPQIDITSPSLRKFKIFVPDTETTEYTWTKCYYDIVATMSDGGKELIFGGLAYAHKLITREPIV